MLDKSLIICYSTPNYSKMTNKFLEHIRGLQMIEDSQLIHKYDDIGNNDKDGFRTEIWYTSVLNKMIHMLDIIKTRSNSEMKYFICTDCDVIFIKENKSYWIDLETSINTSEKDIFFMREGFSSSDVNSGFYIIKNNNKLTTIIEFFEKVILNFKQRSNSSMQLGDQTIINELKSELNYGYIDNDYVIFGANIYNVNKALVHHAVCCTNVDQKLDQIRKVQSALSVRS
jgi:hypothetical protein